MSNKLRCYVQINSVAKPDFQINFAKDIATAFIMSNKLRHAWPPKGLSKINLLCKKRAVE